MNSECINNCPIYGYYISPNSENLGDCIECKSANCTSCTENGQCSNCISGYLLLLGLCNKCVGNCTACIT